MSQKKKWSEIVAAFFEDERGYTLLAQEQDYQNNKSKLKYQCPNHPDKELFISWSFLQQGVGCPYCANELKDKQKRIPFSTIQTSFNNDKRGYILLSSEEDYHKSRGQIKYRCPKHPDKINVTTWPVYSKGHQCPYCANKKIDFVDIQKAFANDERNYILLATENDYKDSATKLSYICPRHPDKINSIS